MEQRAVIKSHLTLGKNANVFLWHKHFLEGRERLEYDNREGRPISAMLITFFDSKGIIHRECIPTGETITGAYHLEF